MGGNQSSGESPQEEPKVEEKLEQPKAEAPPAKETKASDTKKSETKAEAKGQPKAPVPPGAQTSAVLTKPAAKPPKAAAKKKQPGPPQQPGLITPESGKKGKGEKGEKAEKGKGGKKGGNFPGIQLCVRNLVKEASPEQLKNMFQPFGELLNVDVKKNTDGTCRGYGFVTYSKMDDAKKAIAQMDGKQVEGKNLVVVLSDRQQGTTKAEREAQGKGKGKEARDGKGKGNAKGKAKGAAPTPAQPSWPAQGEASYPLNFGYPMVSPMAAYANQGYNAQAAALALQAQMLQQQAMQSQAAWYSSLSQMGMQQQGGNVQAQAPTVSLAAAAPPPSAPPEGQANPNQEYEGTLKSISAKNGYGFIACEDTKAHYKRDVFVDSALLPEGIQVNDKVAFSLALSEKGHPRATAVKLTAQVAAR